MNAHEEPSAEQASRMAVTAVAADLEYWAHSVAVDGRIGLNDLVRVLDMIREASLPGIEEPSNGAPDSTSIARRR